MGRLVNALKVRKRLPTKIQTKSPVDPVSLDPWVRRFSHVGNRVMKHGRSLVKSTSVSLYTCRSIRSRAKCIFRSFFKEFFSPCTDVFGDLGRVYSFLLHPNR